MLTLADMDGQETFDASTLGTASEVRSCIHFIVMSPQASSSAASLQYVVRTHVSSPCPRQYALTIECWLDHRLWRSQWRMMTWS